MYCTKLKYDKDFVFTKVGCITINDPYEKKGLVPSRYKNKQFQTNPPKSKDGGIGYFSKLTYASDPYHSTTSMIVIIIDPIIEYRDTQPLKDRKLGFGTHDASKRDEFTDTINTETYRQLLKREGKLIDEIIEREQTDLTPEEEDKNRFNQPDSLFEFGRTKITEFCQQCHKDTFYCPHKNINKDYGTTHTSYMDLGEGVTDPTVLKKPEFAMSGATKQFLDRSHIH